MIVAAKGKQRSIDPNPAPAGRCVQCNVDGSPIGVSINRALVQRKIRVGVSQHKCGNPSALQFLAQAARERKRDIFLEQGIAEGFPVIVAGFPSSG